jgi:hypothetical protein
MATIMYLLPHWDMKGNALVWLVWMEFVRSSIRKKTLWVLVISIWWKNESLPSIIIRGSGIRIGKKILQMSFLELYHVHIY